MTLAFFVFAQLGHRWPKWAVLAFLLFGIGVQVVRVEPRSVLAILDMAAVVVMWARWDDIASLSAARPHTASLGG